jgi:hypothetical protein
MPAFARFRFVAFGLFALVALLSLPGGALAAAPQINRFTEAYAFTIPADQNPCGVAIQVAGEFKVVEHLFFDKAGHLVKVIANINDAWTDTGPGGTVRGKASVSVTTTDIVQTAEGESWVDIFRGVPIKYSAPGFGVIVRDAGNVAIARTLVFNDPDNPEDDEFSQEIVVEHGPHPTLPGSAQFTEDWIDDYCAILVG